MGRNSFDFQFLETYCSRSSGSRRLRARPGQTRPYEDILYQYRCPLDIPLSDKTAFTDRSYSNATAPTLQVLYMGNCTGEYFGIGPTCRCQESMRYFLSHFVNSTRWFMFMDDDVYVRPHSLRRMLELVDLEDGESPRALVSTSTYRSFRFSDKSKTFNCSHPDGRHNFPIAQPAIINLPGMKVMKQTYTY